MATDARAVVPWLGGCDYREAAWPLVRRHLGIPYRRATAAPWVKGRAIAAGVAACDAEIVVVHDADVVCESGLAEAIAAVAEGTPWAIPHREVRRLSAGATEAVLAGEPLSHELPLDEPAYAGAAGGGIVVALREVLLDVPMDPRFAGWGQADQSWAIALATIAGKPWRGEADLWHLYHPPQERLTRTWGSIDSRRLRRRYALQRRHPDRMRALLDEAKELLHA